MPDIQTIDSGAQRRQPELVLASLDSEPIKAQLPDQSKLVTKFLKFAQDVGP